MQWTLHRSGPTTTAAVKFFHLPMAASTYLSWWILACLLLAPTSSAEQCSFFVLIVIWVSGLYFSLPALFFSCIISPIRCTLWLHTFFHNKKDGNVWKAVWPDAQALLTGDVEVSLWEVQDSSSHPSFLSTLNMHAVFLRVCFCVLCSSSSIMDPKLLGGRIGMDSVTEKLL